MWCALLFILNNTELRIEKVIYVTREIDAGTEILLILRDKSQILVYECLLVKQSSLINHPMKVRSKLLRMLAYKQKKSHCVVL